MTTKKSLLQRFAAAPYTVWAVLFIIVPLVFVIFYAFTDKQGNVSFANWTKIFNGNTLQIFMTSLAFAFISTLICLLIAYPLAYGITKAKAKNQALLILLLMLPMWMNFVLRTYSLSFILDKEGLIYSFLKTIGLGEVTLIGTPGAVIFGMVYNYLPYMLLPIYTVMSKMDIRVIEASEDLGCNKIQTLVKVILPLSLPGIVSGITMVFVPSISTFYISEQLGEGFILVGDTINTLFKGDTLDYNCGSAISLVLMIMIFISLAIMNRFTDEDSEGSVII